MLETRSKTINGTEYKVTQLDAIRGRKVLARMQRVAGNMNQMSDEDMDYLCDVFAPSTCVVSTNDHGQRVEPQLSKIFGLHFAGKYDEMAEWLAFCVEVNFGSFRKRLRSQQDGSPEGASE